MQRVLALDFDGTLVKSFTSEPLRNARAALKQVDSDLQLAVCTNQAGPVFRLAGIGGTRYPTPAEVAQNLDRGLRACGIAPQRLGALLIATWPGETWRGDPADALDAAQDAAAQLTATLTAQGWAAYATASPQWRKPGPGMLVGLATRLNVLRSEIVYVGDRDSDQQAAQAAGVRFVWAKEWWR